MRYKDLTLFADTLRSLNAREDKPFPIFPFSDKVIFCLEDGKVIIDSIVISENNEIVFGKEYSDQELEDLVSHYWEKLMDKTSKILKEDYEFLDELSKFIKNLK